MKRRIVIPMVFFVLFFSAPAVTAQELFVYPSQGQSQEQTEKDKFECYNWARQQTGFDPVQTPAATAPPPSGEAPKGGVIRGGARGAAVGAVGGAIAGDAGRGAAIGAATGALLGGMRRADQRRQEEEALRQHAQQQASQNKQNRDQYNRAYKTCLEGRGYTVN